MKNFLAFLIVVMVALPALASDCGNGLPCGPVPWNLPALPTLQSPTPMPTFSFTVTPSPTMTPTNFTPSPTPSFTSTPTATFTVTPTATNTPMFDTDGLLNQIATLQALINETPISIDLSGTPVSVGGAIDSSTGDVIDFFSHVKGVMNLDLGPFRPLAYSAILGVAVKFVIIFIVYAVPVIGFLVGMIRKIYSAIMDFIPG